MDREHLSALIKMPKHKLCSMLKARTCSEVQIEVLCVPLSWDTYVHVCTDVYTRMKHILQTSNISQLIPID